MTSRIAQWLALPLAALAIGCSTLAADGRADTASADPAQWPAVATIDARFQSYNIEMVEITGGRFWAPYGGVQGERYRQREPVDLANPRLRALAQLLAPAFVRVSGTWANSTYVPRGGEVVSAVPPGFGQILQRQQWHGLVDFARALEAPIVTSFAASDGTRDAQGRWTSEQADRFLALTREAGGSLYAAEFINEPSLIGPGDLPPDYDSTAFAQDFATFAQWAGVNAPDMILLGPGNLGEATVDPQIAASLMAPGGLMAADALLARTAHQIDAVSWHFYGGVSPRCGGGTGLSGPEAALGLEWLDRTLIEYDAIEALRSRHAPGKPLWLTETAQAACGGSPWAAGFRDSFRYLNQLGLMAQRGVQVVMHNTLDASEYGLIDSATLQPRANFWAAVLWQRHMGSTVLQSPPVANGNLRTFAHCLPQFGGGVGVLALNLSDRAEVLALTGAGQAYVLTAANMDQGPVQVNGTVPAMADNGTVSGLEGAAFADQLTIPAQAIAFVSLPDAGNPACRV